MQNRPHLLLWTDSPGPYIDAIRNAGLADQVAIDTLARVRQPSEGQRASTTVLLAAGAPPGLLPTMPNLTWAQSLTAGVEGWLALPDLPPGLTLTCARGTHRESMPENILGALFHITKPYAAIVEDQKQRLWRHRVATPLNGRTLGILGLGAIGQEVARLATALGMRVVGTKRRPGPLPGLVACWRWKRPAPSWRNRTTCWCYCRPRARPRTSSTPNACAA
jgi:phosphoglycerate dehydrogenase-like enzyme